MFVIGGGRVGTALYAMALANGRQPCTLITRTNNWHELQKPAGRAIMVATRNDDLEAVVSRVPLHRHDDLVFIQNGMIRPFLKRRGLAHCTRGLMYFAVSKRGDVPRPGGKSPFSGPRAANVVAWMNSSKIPAREVDAAEFGALELEKLSWNCAFGLMCEVYKETVGNVADRHGDELAKLVREFAAIGRKAMDVKVSDRELLRHQVAYARSISSYRGAIKEWDWRNGWFIEAAAKHEIEAPVHEELLRRAGRLE